MAEKQMTKLDEKLREMALVNWDQFVALIGEEAILKAKMCMMRKDGASYGQICMKLGVKKGAIRYNCSKCEQSIN